MGVELGEGGLAIVLDHGGGNGVEIETELPFLYRYLYYLKRKFCSFVKPLRFFSPHILLVKPPATK